MSSPFDFGDYKAVAQMLASQGGEAELRSAVSRLYYALFHVARNQTQVHSRRDTHSKVINAVRTRNKGVGDQLDNLKRLRQAADYDSIPQGRTISPDWQINWQRASQIAESLLPKLNKI